MCLLLEAPFSATPDAGRSLHSPCLPEVGQELEEAWRSISDIKYLGYGIPYTNNIQPLRVTSRHDKIHAQHDEEISQKMTTFNIK